MKLITMLLVSVAFAGTPINKVVPVTNIYIPAGFDANDNVEVIIGGVLPNLCHKSPKTTVERSDEFIDITLSSLYYHKSNPFCPETLVPFTKTVDIGVVPKGQYTIRVNHNTDFEKEEPFTISGERSDNIDDYQYAYVEEITKGINPNIIVLSGYNPSNCFEIDKISYISNNKDTYSVLPRLKKIRDFCPMKMTPFTINWKLPNDLDRETVLLHVRTLNGNSVNKVIKNK